jgi:hypothetical protein
VTKISPFENCGQIISVFVLEAATKPRTAMRNGLDARTWLRRLERIGSFLPFPMVHFRVHSSAIVNSCRAASSMWLGACFSAIAYANKTIGETAIVTYHATVLCSLGYFVAIFGEAAQTSFLSTSCSSVLT